MVTFKDSLDGAIRSDNNRKIKIDLGIPMPTYLTETGRLGKYPASYGLQIPMKIIYDCLGILTASNSQREIGDAYSISPILNLLARIIYYEIKCSFLDVDEDTYRIDHIRDYQDFDFFILCFVDRLDKYKGRFYIIPKDFICDNPSVFKLSAMNSSKHINRENKNCDEKVRIKRKIAYELFEEHSFAPSSNYKDVLHTLINHHLHDVLSKTMEMPKALKFDVNGTIVKGKTNEDTWIKFANCIGPLNSEMYFPSCCLSTQPSEYRTIRLRLGNHWLDSNIPPTEAQRIIKWGNKKTGLNVKLL